MSFSASVEKLIETSSSGLVKAAPWWGRIRLDCIAEILNGYPWKSNQFDIEKGVPVVRIRDVTSGATETFYRGKIEDDFWIKDGDVLVGMDGDFNSRIWMGGKALLNQRVCRITPNEKFYLKELLAYVLPGYLRLINDETHSITVKHLSSKTLAELPLPLPSLTEQRRIVAKLGSLATKSRRCRGHLDHILRLVEKYKRAILVAAFRGELTRDWRVENASGPTAAHFVERRLKAFMQFCESKRGGRDERAAQAVPDDDLLAEFSRTAITNPLPSNWCWTSVGSVFGVYVGATPSRKCPEFWGGAISWVSSGEVAFCKIEKTHETITNVGLENASTRVHPPGTVLVGMIGEGKTRGQAAILGISAANNQNCAAIRVSEAGYSSDYVYWHFWVAYERTREMGAGNNQPALNKDRVQRILIPLAPVSEAAEIARRIETAFKWIDRLATEAGNARRLIDHLDQAVLAKVFQGELVPQDPSDEPASALLDRIRAERAKGSDKPSKRTRSGN